MSKKQRRKKKRKGRWDKKLLRRYTDLAALRLLLQEQKLTLRDPQSWTDTNDSYYLELYCQKMGLSSVLALCFTQSSERFHYWSTFGKGTNETERVKIKFKHSGLVAAIKGQSSLDSRSVEYLKMNDMKIKNLTKEELPFTKRWGFNHESEFRIIYKSEKEKVSEFDIRVPLSCITKITLSPWLSHSSFKILRAELRRIKDCSGIRIERSTITSSKEWKKYGENAA